MIKLKKILSEAPIDTFQTIGDFSKGSSFTNKVDRALVTNPTSVQKVKDFFQNTEVDFDFYFVNSKEARKYTELGEVKESFIYDKLNIKPEQLKDGRINRDAITVFFTNNKGGERLPLTAWIIAHRLGHVLRRQHNWDKELAPWVEGKLARILETYGIAQVHRNYYDDGNYRRFREYQLATRHLCETIGTFKSARDKNLREEFEFLYELFAQFLKNGSVKFNPLPDVLLTGHGAFGRKEYRRLKDRENGEYHLTDLANTFPYYVESVLGENIGKIFVM
jgi:hypothetical protein